MPGSPGSPSSSAILPLDSKAIFAFQRDGHHAEALHAIASSVASVQAAHGKHSLETVKISLVGARLCNELALSSMQRGAAAFSFDAAFEYLQRAMRMPDVSLALRAVTLNNLSIYYARTGQPHAALRCLQRVVKQSSTAAHADDVSVHVALNLTTVLADLGRHREALETAHGAVRSLTERINENAPLSLQGAVGGLLQQQAEEAVSAARKVFRKLSPRSAHARSGAIASPASLDLLIRNATQAALAEFADRAPDYGGSSAASGWWPSRGTRRCCASTRATSTASCASPSARAPTATPRRRRAGGLARRGEGAGEEEEGALLAALDTPHAEKLGRPLTIARAVGGRAFLPRTFL